MTVQDAKGKLNTPIGFDPSGNVLPLHLDANGNLLIYISGGSVTVTPHNLLDGSIHPDTVAGTPVLGDVIVGTDIGGGIIKWQRMARGSAGQFLRVKSDNSLEWATVTGGYTQGCRAYGNADQTLSNITFTALTLNVERWDTDTMHDTVTNNTRMTCKTAGKYVMHGGVRYEAHATGVRVAAVRLNGSTYISMSMIGTVATVGQVMTVECSTIYDLAVNDYVELMGYQNSGGDLKVLSVAAVSPEFSIQRIG